MRTPLLLCDADPVTESTSDPHQQPRDDDDDLPPTFALGLATTPVPVDPSLPRVRGYEILSVVGRGGMGIVYEARHKELNRRVAIKTLRGEALADPLFRWRFQAEAAAIAKLQHPNIIQIFEVGAVEPSPGESHPSPFIALEFVDGGSLSRRTHAPQPPAYAARIVETLARAAHAAHRLGVIHRDLKPSNVLLTCDGVPKIADFGIAKQVDAERHAARQLLTRDGAMMGTPEYMAPELLEGGAATPSIDVYALGVILYELLTAYVPFQGATFADTLRLAVEQEPLAPRKLQPGVPRDLETICLKCLEKNPANRYASAAALADDLARWSDGQPILARPIGPVERMARWAKRNPAVALLSVAVLLVAFAGVAGIGWEWNEAIASAAKAESAAKAARESARKERWERYRVDVMSASSSLRLHDVNAARRSLENAPPEHRDWVWNLLNARLDRSQRVLGRGDSERSHRVEFNRGGRAAVVQRSGGACTIWDLDRQREHGPVDDLAHARSIVLSDDGAILAYGDRDHSVILRDTATGRPRAVLKGHTDLIDHVSFSTDGRLVVSTSVDRSVRVWSVETGASVRMLALPKDVNSPITVCPRQRYAVAATQDNTSRRVFDLQTGRELPSLGKHRATILATRFSPDGGRLATVEDFPSNTLLLWELSSGRLLGEMRGHTNTLTEVAFSPDGARLVTASLDRTLRIWDVSPGAERDDAEPLHILEGHSGTVSSAAFSPDGSRIVSSSHDCTLRYWNTRTGKSLAVLHGHVAPARSCRMRADGATIVSASDDGAIRFWNVEELEREYALQGHDTFVYGVAFHPDGERVVSASWDGTARIWNATTGRALRTLDHGKGNYVASVACRPDGKSLATYARDDSVRLWDAETGDLLHRWKTPTNHFIDSRVVFSPDGKLLAAGSHDGCVRLWDVDTRAEVAVLKQHPSAVMDLAFSPDGRWLASGGSHGDRTICVWNVPAKQLVRVLTGHESAVSAVAWNHDGTRLASGSLDDGLVLVWDTSTWEKPVKMKQGAKVHGLAFTPDGKLLAAACSDNLIRLWNAQALQIVAELSGHTDYVHQVAFSPDGTRLVSASGDRTLRVWDTLSRAERERASKRLEGGK